MVLTSPLMLVGLAAVPILTAIYWLRSRSRRAVVSSLAFWSDQRSPRRGGRILHRLQTPLTFFLELAAITALVVAAAGPAMLRRDVVRPLAVVLDDSYSMLAGNAQDSPRRRAEAAVLGELQGGNYQVRFILAGRQPRLLGEPLGDPAACREVLRQWACQDASADLPAALALATEVGSAATRVLVVTDQPPAMDLDGGQVRWWAFGEEVPNMAFTAATRTRSGDKERVLLEIANLSRSAGTSTLILEGGNLASARTSNVELASGAARQIILSLPTASPPLRATLARDALEIDNRVLLLPESTRPLRVQIDLADTNLRRAVRRALESTLQTIDVSDRPELLVTDQPGSIEGDAWRVEILGGKDPAAYAGPFIIDHNHALTQGLSLENVIWSKSDAAVLSGVPIVTAGNVLLMTVSEDPAGRRRLQMGFVPRASNFQDTPDWPIVFANLVSWRRSGRAGLASPNVRLGDTAVVTLARDAHQVELSSPGEPARKLGVRGRRIAMPVDRVGLYTLRTDEADYPFSANTVSRDESDLTGCRSGRWGTWNDSPVYQDRQVSLRWLFLLAAMTAMAGHGVVVARQAGGPQS
jgi:hypothetical protein